MSGAGDGWRGGRNFNQNRQRNSNTGGMSGTRGGQQSSNAPSTSWADEVAELDGDQHTPVGAFNAAEAKGALRLGPGAPRPYFYKPQGKDANNRSGPWATKPNNMASGKDFFLELRKQVTALRQGDNVAGG